MLRKSLILLVVPFLVLLLAALLPHPRRDFGEHVVCALHLFAFFQLGVLALAVPIRLVALPLEWTGAIDGFNVDPFLFVMLFVYQMVAVRRVSEFGRRVYLPSISSVVVPNPGIPWLKPANSSWAATWPPIRLPKAPSTCLLTISAPTA